MKQQYKWVRLTQEVYEELQRIRVRLAGLPGGSVPMGNPAVNGLPSFSDTIQWMGWVHDAAVAADRSGSIYTETGNKSGRSRRHGNQSK